MRPLLRLALGLLGSAVLACGVRKPQAEVVPSPTRHATPDLATQVAPDNLVKRRALYFPNQTIHGAMPSGFQELEVTTSDGLPLDAWYKAPPTGGRLLLYFHGNGGNLSSLGPQFEAFEEAGAGVLAVDYRGYGKSAGSPSEAGFYLDSEATYAKALELGYQPEQIVIYGRSLGGGVATYLAAKKQAAGLILESTFTSVTETARRTHGHKAAMLVTGFPNLDRMPKISIPVLIIHGMADRTIPSDMATTLGEASPNSQVWMIDGADHNNVRRVAGSEYVSRLRDFLEGLPDG